MVLVGVQPVLMQVPPRCAFSISATFQPRSARLYARGLSPWPEPMIIASYFIVETPFQPNRSRLSPVNDITNITTSFRLPPRRVVGHFGSVAAVEACPGRDRRTALVEPRYTDTNPRAGVSALAAILSCWRPAQFYSVGLTAANHQG